MRGKLKYKFTLYVLCLAGGIIVGYLKRPYYDLTRYEKIIERQAHAFALDKKLVHAVIMTESGGDVKAVSSKGAMGLMQLVPETALELAQEMEIPLKRNDDLFQPEYNIRLGCYYLYLLMHRFRGCLCFVLAAYNTGPNRVEKWANESANLSAYEIVMRKGSRETRDFIRKVLQRYDNGKNFRN